MASSRTMDLGTMPLEGRHIWITFVASLGQLIGTGVATLAGIIIPMLNILSRPQLGSAMQGLIGSADLIGIMIGASVIGRLIDRYGYLLFFRLCPALILAASVVAALTTSVPVLVVALFVIGIGIGGEYSLDSGYISELLPIRWRSTMIGVAKAASALGNIVVAGLCWWLVTRWDTAEAWPKLMWIVAAIAAVMLVCRIRFWESPLWLLQKGRTAEAEECVRRFLGPDVMIEPQVKSAPAAANTESGWSFLRKNFSRLMLSGVPWACEGLGVYGIGVFLPILVMSLGIEHVTAGESAIAHVAASIETTFFISCVILPGFILGIIMLRRKAYIPRLQSVGFWLSALSLGVLLVSYHFGLNRWISIIAFMAFELFLNMGPHLTTYVLPPKIYPVEDRGLGSGMSASAGKLGAVIAVFLIPVLLKAGGIVLVLGVSVAVMAVGAIVTSIYAPRVLSRQQSDAHISIRATR